MYLNRVMIYGNITRDPESKALPSGTSVTNFSVATNRTYKDKDGQKQEQAEFHNIVAFGKTAEIVAQYMRKGSAIYVEGRLQTRSWEKDGVKRYTTEIVAENVQFGPRKDRQNDEETAQDAPGDDAGEAIESEDLPF